MCIHDTSGRSHLHRIVCKMIPTRWPTRISYLPLWAQSPHTQSHHLPLRTPHAATHQHCHCRHSPPPTIHQTLHYEERSCVFTRPHTSHQGGYTPRDRSSATLTSCAWTRSASGTRLGNRLYRESPDSPWLAIILNYWRLTLRDSVIFNITSTICVRPLITLSLTSSQLTIMGAPYGHTWVSYM